MPPLIANDVVWQDREVRFDSAPREMQCRKGEVVIDSINSVEDTKGNNGERGVGVCVTRLLSVAGRRGKSRLCVLASRC